MQANLSGTTLGKYQLRDLLGAGGMGAVYRAYDHSLKREVAVKVINLGASGPDAQARFIREAQTAANLEHSHIVRVYDYGVERDINYVVMQNLTGGSLSERMKQAALQGRPRASLPEVALLLEQLASALDYAHLQGVVHRDIKPQNVMFNNQGQAFLVDFGIAKLLTGATNLTGTNMAMGTPSYMPPEQWSQRELTPAADQYALAVMTYQLIAGRLPFEADSVPSLWYKIENEQPTPLTTIRPDVPRDVVLVIVRAMAKNPADRFPNCTQFAQAFASAVSGVRADSTNYFTFKLARMHPAGAAPTPTPPITSPPGKTPTQITLSLPAGRGLLIGAVGVLVVIAVLVLLVLSTRGPSESELRLTSVNQTLVAAGLATDSAATRVSSLELISSETPESLATDAATTTETAIATNSPRETATIEDESIHLETSVVPIARIETEQAQATTSPTNSPSSTPSLSPREAALATLDAGATETATHWTQTPTEDYAATVAAELTAVFVETQIARATARAEEAMSLQATQDKIATEDAGATAAHSVGLTETQDTVATADAAATAAHLAGLTQTATLWTLTPTVTDTETPTATATVTPTASETATNTATATAPPTATETDSPTPTETATDTATATETATHTATATSTASITPSPTDSLTPTFSPSVTPVMPTPSPTSDVPIEAISMQPGEVNADWMPAGREFDGVTMVLVPSGCFDMGSDEGGGNELPVHMVCFDAPFWLDQLEVSQAQFAAFGGIAETASFFTGENLPIDSLTWYEARDYCTLRGARLPTEAEWEFAARGPQSWDFPWGDEFEADIVNWGTFRSSTSEVESMPGGISWVATLHMSGNVLEWTNSLYLPYPYDAGDGREDVDGAADETNRVLRGGRWGYPTGLYIGGARREKLQPENILRSGSGVRCARDFEPTDYAGISKIAYATVTVLAASANLRDGPSTANTVVDTASRGESFSVVGQRGDWYLVDRGGGETAWISSSVVDISVHVGVPPEVAVPVPTAQPISQPTRQSQAPTTTTSNEGGYEYVRLADARYDNGPTQYARLEALSRGAIIRRSQCCFNIAIVYTHPNALNEGRRQICSVPSIRLRQGETVITPSRYQTGVESSAEGPLLVDIHNVIQGFSGEVIIESITVCNVSSTDGSPMPYTFILNYPLIFDE